MSEQKAKPDKPNSQDGGTASNQGGQGDQGNKPRDWRTLIGHEDKGQKPDHIRLIDTDRRRRDK